MSVPLVYQDGALGVWNVEPAKLGGRLVGYKALGFTDVFTSRDATVADMYAIRARGLRAHVWWAVDGLSAAAYAARTLADIARLKPGTGELNIELTADAPLPQYIGDVVRALRVKRPTFRFRVNVGAYKGFGFLGAPFGGDPNLYACEQSYYGDMSPVQADECLRDMLEHGVPSERASLCYGAAGPIGVAAATPHVWDDARHLTLGTWYYDGIRTRQLRRGLVFQDDLLSEVGLL